MRMMSLVRISTGRVVVPRIIAARLALLLRGHRTHATLLAVVETVGAAPEIRCRVDSRRQRLLHAKLGDFLGQGTVCDQTVGCGDGKDKYMLFYLNN